MTAWQLLREKASKLNHANDRGVDIYDHDKKLVQKIEPTHMLTCERCRLEKEADEFERQCSNRTTI